MSIRPIDFNGMVQRTQDIGTLKQHEDNKPVFDQQALANKIQKDTKQNMHQVNHGENAENYQKKYDAREKGSNEYQRNKGSQKKKADKSGGRVVPKSSYGGFDISI